MKISIITVSYNDCEGLRRTIESIRKQTSHNYEYIVMDGGSADSSVELIKQNQDIITYWESKRDGGPFFGMNNGISHATGDFCIFMNGGDSFYDERVIEQFVAEERTKDIYTGIAAEHIADIVTSWYPAHGDEFCMRWFYRHSLSHQSSFIKTSLIKELKYDTEFRIVADWLFFMYALLNRRATYSSLPFTVSNYMDGGISRDEQKAFKERDKAIVKYYGERILKDFHSMHYGLNEWDTLSKSVDPLSKSGKLIMLLTKLLLKIRV